MPSLEILDIGRNKIKRLPTQPGSLVNLRVRFLRAPLGHVPLHPSDFSGVLVLSK
jgi:Leucine-rich repeat (LRR) protein